METDESQIATHRSDARRATSRSIPRKTLNGSQWQRRKQQRRTDPTNGNGKRLNSQQSVNAAVKAICDIMRRSNCAGAMQYVPELTWILFLRILDERETHEAEDAEAVGAGLHAVDRIALPLAGLGRARQPSAGRKC